MKEKIEERKLITDIHMIKRACKLINVLTPRLLTSSIIKSIISAFIPYISIYMSALIIDELVGDKNFKLLVLYVFITIGGTLFVTVISEILLKRINVLNAMFGVKLMNYLNNIRFEMDFTKQEDPKYIELYAKIKGIIFMTNGGITSIVGFITSIVDNAISVLIALVIIQRSTMISVTSYSGSDRIKNQIIFIISLMIVIMLCITLTVRNSNNVSKKEFSLYENSSVNRYLDYYHFYYMEDDQAGKEIHIFDQRQLIIDEVRSKGRKPWLKVLNDKYNLYQKYYGVNVVISAFIGGFSYIYIGLRALSGSISLGNLTKSYTSITKLVSSLGNLSVSLSQIKSNNNYLEILYEFLDTPTMQQNGKQTLSQSKDNFELEFHDVSFRYPSYKEYVIKNLSLKISSNSRIAIVGMNGSGKTTMIKLFCGLYQPETGYITLNGKDIREYDLKMYHKLFSIVFQDFMLLALNVGENVAVSRVYDDEKVWHSLKVAGIDKKVHTLPLELRQNIYKYVDPDGMDISGGEEQKLAIARAFYKDAPIIIFDEPTAALDPVAEYEIYSRFNEIIGDKTALFVSHRLSSCRFCDNILVFHNGEIIQFGKHDELLKDAYGKYFELWNAQAQYYQ